MKATTHPYSSRLADVDIIGYGLRLILALDASGHPNHPNGGCVTHVAGRFSRSEQDCGPAAMVQGF